MAEGREDGDLARPPCVRTAEGEIRRNRRGKRFIQPTGIGMSFHVPSTLFSKQPPCQWPDQKMLARTSSGVRHGT